MASSSRSPDARERLPLQVKVPNAATRRAMAELEQGKGKRFDSAEALFKYLRCGFRFAPGRSDRVPWGGAGGLPERPLAMGGAAPALHFQRHQPRADEGDHLAQKIGL